MQAQTTTQGRMPHTGGLQDRRGRPLRQVTLDLTPRIVGTDKVGGPLTPLRRSSPTSPLAFDGTRIPSVPSPSASPPDTPHLSALERLDRLLTTIDSVLRAYSIDRNHSPIHMRSLHNFLHRASDLYPHEGQNSWDGPDEDEVNRLEKEWWGSCVVAAWYGPRPGYGPMKMLANGGNDNGVRRRRRSKELSLKRDSSYVGL
ncbi:hypothetical protein TREMEDRAFT_74470, partial [Tremella mesenterica DSM 1558]|uniref:uncharacterized protein n=1 Tax=Tremella mesenterica (strain ATCC 24925 / CBS 8224 / DSM 1558 / NBRC 9311 / NRRL Y-6157 / RJB 2259-6 / UBC 559-6) TaxID=578456 RepID=UPI0003F4A336